MSSQSAVRNLVRRAGVRRGLALSLSLLLIAAGLLPAVAVPSARAARQEEPAEAPTFAAPEKKKTPGIIPGAEFVPGQLLVRFREESATARLAVAKSGGDAARQAKAMNAADRVALPLRAANGEAFEVGVESFGGTELVPGLLLGHTEADKTLEAVAALNARADVLYAEPDYIWRKTATPNDPRFGEQYAMQRISAPAAWDLTQGSESVVVGIVDGGVDLNHEDLQANAWVNPGDSTVDGVDNDGNGRVDDTNGWDFHNNDRTVFDGQDGDDHGTHVAGTVGARGNNSIGVTGVNWRVKLASIKVLGPTGGSSSNFISGYNYARDLKVNRGVNLRVLNNSYGGPGSVQSAKDAIQQLADAGILFVAAAGNEQRDNFAYPHFPSDYNLTNVIGVASTNSGDGLSGFSNFGARVVSIGAPGSSILSTVPTSMQSACNGMGSAPFPAYCFYSGTSMATPHVAGAAALVIADKPNISMQELRGVLAYSGDLLPSLAEKTTTGRRLNVRKAIESARENDTINPAPAGGLQITSQTGRTLSLSWTAPGDDGTTGTAADYDFFFVNSANGVRTLLPTSFAPSPGNFPQAASVNVPLRSFSGTIELVTYDNTGRSSTASLPVNVPVNQGSDPYVVTQSAAEPLSTGGERLGLDGDDKYTMYPMPFTFQFYGQNEPPAVTVSTNGALYFSSQAPPVRDNGDADDLPSNIAAMRGTKMIAGMWDDLMIVTSGTGARADAGVYVVKPSSDRIIFRWQGTEFDSPTTQINFEIELRQDGTVITRYGAGNTTLFPVVGISIGEPEPYIVESHTADRTLTNTRKTLTSFPTVTFSRRAAPVTTFQFSQPNYEVNENGGAVTVTVTRAGDIFSQQAVTFATTTGGTATEGADYQSTGARLVFNAGETSKTHGVTVFNDAAVEPTETVHLMLHTPEGGATLGAPARATLFIRDEDQGGANTTQFGGTGMLNVSENAGAVTVTVTRTGDASQPASVNYATADGSAKELGDYTTALGTLRFAAGETTKTFDVLITDDVYDDEGESFTVALSGASATALGAQSSVTVNITDNDAATQFSPVREQNFNGEFFARQHYIDFLNRQPDASGLAFWAQQTSGCDNTDVRVCRINVSAAFFLSIEFQETGVLVYRANQVAFNTRENLPFSSFLRDTQQVSRGVVIGQPGADALLEANKVAYFNELVQRPAFLAFYPLAMSNNQFVAELNAKTGNSLNATQANAYAAGLDNLTETRATVLRKVVENQTFANAERSRAFVYMQYVGYLRRQPDAGGFNFWLAKLNQFNGDFIAAEMVKAFITSGEYIARFGTP